MSALTEERLAEIEAREKAATPGPWIHDGSLNVDGPRGQTILISLLPARLADVRFAAAARQDVPALVAEVRRLRRIFDDAGQGEHNVLALVEHYQDEAMERKREATDWAIDADSMQEERDAARAERDAALHDRGMAWRERDRLREAARRVVAAMQCADETAPSLPAALLALRAAFDGGTP